jgi:Holliday junction resolvase RusA-like endonuclease
MGAGLMAITIVLALPPPELHPNARTHWGKRARATRNARGYAFLMGVKAVRGNPPLGAASLQARFFFPDARKRDRDNLLAWLKAYIDGLADAEVVVNDAAFTFPPVEVHVDRDRPRVELVVTPV